MEKVLLHMYSNITWGIVHLLLILVLAGSLIHNKVLFCNGVSTGGVILCTLKCVYHFFIARSYYQLSRVNVDVMRIYARISIASECVNLMTEVILIVLFLLMLYKLKKSQSKR